MAKIEDKFGTYRYTPLRNLGEGQAKSMSQFFVPDLGPNLWYTGRLLIKAGCSADWGIRGPLVKSTREGLPSRGLIKQEAQPPQRKRASAVITPFKVIQDH